jgi:hypothetical protein
MYVIADLVGPQLGIIDIVVLVGQVIVDHVVYLLRHKRTDVVEHCFLLLSHHPNITIVSQLTPIKYLNIQNKKMIYQSITHLFIC